MCKQHNPFQQRNGEWWKYGGWWTSVLLVEAAAEDPTEYIPASDKKLGEMGIQAAFISHNAAEGEEHMLSCALHAMRSWARGNPVTRRIGLEALLYAAGTRHVDKAISIAGLKREKKMWVILFCPEGKDIPDHGDVAHVLKAKSLEKPWNTRGTREAVERAAMLEAHE